MSDIMYWKIGKNIFTICVKKTNRFKQLAATQMLKLYFCHNLAYKNYTWTKATFKSSYGIKMSQLEHWKKSKKHNIKI